MAARLLPNVKMYFTDDNGNPLVGGKLYTYEAQTDTPKITFADPQKNTENTNPVILDARGEAPVFWEGAYYIELFDADDNLIWTADNITSFISASDVFLSNNISVEDYLINGTIHVVDTMSDLVAVNSSIVSTVFVRGYYAAGDGGGGLYWYDSGDNTSANNGGTIIVATDNARWKLELFGQSISLRQFGAVADGITNCYISFLACTGWAANFCDVLIDGNFYINAGEIIAVAANTKLKGYFSPNTINTPPYKSSIILSYATQLNLQYSEIDGVMVMAEVISLNGTYPIDETGISNAGVAAYEGTAFYAVNKVSNCSVVGFEYAGSLGIGHDGFENVMVDCTNGFIVPQEKSVTSRNYEFGNLLNSAVPRSGYPLKTQGSATGKLSFYGFNAYGYNTEIDANANNIFYGGRFSPNNCTAINLTYDYTLQTIGCYFNNAEGFYSIYVGGDESGARYIVDGCENAKVNLGDGAGYGSITNCNLFDVSGDADAKLRCYIGDNIQAPAQISYTPVLDFGGDSTGITYDTQIGAYNIIGNYVFGWANIILTNKGSAADASASLSVPLPISTTTGTTVSATFPIYTGINLSASQSGIVGYGTSSLSKVAIYAGAQGTGGSAATSLTKADFSNTSAIYMAFSYPIDR